MRKTANLVLLLILILTFAVAALPQQPQAQFKTKAEYDGYNGAFTEKDPAKKADLAAKFLADFKDTDPSFKMNAYIMMTKGYLDAKNFAKAMDASAKVTDVLPTLDAQKKVQIYGYGMAAAQAADDVPKTVEFGEKILGANPADVNTLITLAGLIPERLPTDDSGKKAALEKAEGYAKRGLAELAKIQKPANISDADWAAIAAGLHADLGLINLNRLDYDKTIEEYQMVLKATPKDGVGHFRIGLAYSGQAAALSKAYVASVDQQNEAIKNNADKTVIDDLKAKSNDAEQKLRDKRTQATDELATAVAIGGPVQQPATDQLKKLWTGTPEEMNQLIQSKKPQ